MKKTLKEPTETDSSDSDWDDDAPGKHTKKPLTRAEAKALGPRDPMEEDPGFAREGHRSLQGGHRQGGEELGGVGVRPTFVPLRSCAVLRTAFSRSASSEPEAAFATRAAAWLKCRVVALGHKDPHIFRLNRECATPNRTSEHILTFASWWQATTRSSMTQALLGRLGVETPARRSFKATSPPRSATSLPGVHQYLRTQQRAETLGVDGHRPAQGDWLPPAFLR